MPSFIKRVIGIVVIVLALFALNMAMSNEGFYGFGLPYYYSHLLRLAGINVILAVSLNLITGFTGQFSIGHAGFMAVGAYSSAYLTVYYTQGWEQRLTEMMGATAAEALIFLLVLLVAALAAAIAGLVVGIPSLRLRGDYLAIVTLGFAEIIRILLVNVKSVGGPTGFSGAILPPGMAPEEVATMGWRATIPPYANFFWIGLFAVITIVVVYNIVRSDTGRALISIREDELASQAMGINTTRYKVLAFVISSAFAGIAGALYGHYNQFLSTQDFQFFRSFEVIIMIVLGGMGSITGSILGAVVITALPELLRTYPYEIIILLVLIPMTVLLLRAIGRQRLPAFLRSGVGYYALVAASYIGLFAIAQYALLDVILNTNVVLLILIMVMIPLTGKILHAIDPGSLPQSLRSGLGRVAFGLALYLALVFGLYRIALNILAYFPGLDLRLGAVIGEISKYRLVIYSAMLIAMMLTRPQGLLGHRELGLSWLKRAQRRPEGDEAVGASKGVAIAERDAPTTDPAKEKENI